MLWSFQHYKYSSQNLKGKLLQFLPKLCLYTGTYYDDWVQIDILEEHSVLIESSLQACNWFKFSHQRNNLLKNFWIEWAMLSRTESYRLILKCIIETKDLLHPAILPHNLWTVLGWHHPTIYPFLLGREHHLSQKKFCYHILSLLAPAHMKKLQFYPFKP